MDAIKQWFNGEQDYTTGVALYAMLPTKKPQVLKRLNRGKNNHNMATLVAELRKFKNAPKKPDKPAKQKQAPPVVKITQETINTETQRRQISQDAVKREFAHIRLGDLPPELRPKFLRAQAIFYDMIELKFALNDLPPEAEASALKIMLQIEDLDEERDILWAELHHWKAHKTLLTTAPATDFTTLTAIELMKTHQNLKSSISKISKRIEGWYDALDNETNTHQQNLIENKINKSEKLLFKHEQDLNQIKKLI